MRALSLLYNVDRVLLSYSTAIHQDKPVTADNYSTSYKIFGEDSDSEDDSEYAMDDTDHELVSKLR